MTARRQYETEGRSYPRPEQMAENRELLARPDIISLQCNDTGNSKADKKI